MSGGSLFFQNSHFDADDEHLHWFTRHALLECGGVYNPALCYPFNRDKTAELTTPQKHQIKCKLLQVNVLLVLLKPCASMVLSAVKFSRFLRSKPPVIHCLAVGPNRSFGAKFIAKPTGRPILSDIVAAVV